MGCFEADKAPGTKHVWVVDWTGAGDTRAIATAVGRATDGDLILVRSGTYHEGYFLVDKCLAIVEDEGATAVLDGGGTGTKGFNITADGVNIEGFEITGYAYGVGARTSLSRIVLRDLYIRDCPACGIVSFGGTAEDCTIENSAFGAAYVDGAVLRGSTFKNITNNGFYSCTSTTVEDGMFENCLAGIRYSGNMVIRDCVFTDCVLPIMNNTSPELTGCVFSGGSSGLATSSRVQ